MADGITLRSLESNTADELSELLLLLEDIRRCFLTMKHWFENSAPELDGSGAAVENCIADALLRDSVVQFVGAFDRTANYSLDAEIVFDGIEGGVAYILWLKDIRDSYAAHRFGTLRQCVAGVFVDDQGTATGVGHLAQFGYPIDGSQKEQLLQCISVVGRFLEGKVVELQERLLSEAEELSAEALLKLPPARTYAPSREELRMSRRKLRAKKRN